MNPQTYGLAALSISVLAVLVAIFKRRINKAFAPSAESQPRHAGAA
jgi:hypothetical protein